MKKLILILLVSMYSCATSNIQQREQEQCKDPYLKYQIKDMESDWILIH